MTWKQFLDLGREVHLQDANLKECFIRNALVIAENTYGSESAEAGLCLMDLADFLEDEGDIEEAEIVTVRYREILSQLSVKLGLS
jgi:hypothetical protein